MKRNPHPENIAVDSHGLQRGRQIFRSLVDRHACDQSDARIGQRGRHPAQIIGAYPDIGVDAKNYVVFGRAITVLKVIHLFINPDLRSATDQFDVQPGKIADDFFDDRDGRIATVFNREYHLV